MNSTQILMNINNTENPDEELCYFGFIYKTGDRNRMFLSLFLSIFVLVSLYLFIESVFIIRPLNIDRILTFIIYSILISIVMMYFFPYGWNSIRIYKDRIVLVPWRFIFRIFWRQKIIFHYNRTLIIKYDKVEKEMYFSQGHNDQTLSVNNADEAEINKLITCLMSLSNTNPKIKILT